MFYYFCVLFFITFPWLFYVGIVFFSGFFNPQTKSSNQTLCLSPNCYRCAKNKQELKRALDRYTWLFSSNRKVERILNGLRSSANFEGTIFLKLPFEVSRPIWTREQLTSSFTRDLELLRNARSEIETDCEKIFEKANLWSQNDEKDGVWYTFALINQGQWQEQRCRECPNLTSLLHQLDSLITDCIFGNVFISMLPGESKIAEHRGITNARLRVHFGVDIPSDPDHCFMVVGGERFTWTPGDSVIIDDSYKHFVSSRGCSKDRVALILDFWHPALTLDERDCLRQVFPAPNIIFSTAQL